MHSRADLKEKTDWLPAIDRPNEDGGVVKAMILQGPELKPSPDGKGKPTGGTETILLHRLFGGANPPQRDTSSVLLRPTIKVADMNGNVEEVENPEYVKMRQRFPATFAAFEAQEPKKKTADK